MRCMSGLLSVVGMAAFASAATYDVMVGTGGQQVFTPSTTTAVAGDKIRFLFYTGSHDAVMGDFSSPCTTGSIANPFNSGYMTVISPAVQGVSSSSCISALCLFLILSSLLTTVPSHRTCHSLSQLTTPIQSISIAVDLVIVKTAW